MTPKEELIAALRAVANLRRDEAKTKAEKAALWKQHMEAIEHTHGRVKDALAAAEDDLRVLAVKHRTHCVDGVTVKNFTTIDYNRELALRVVMQCGLVECLDLKDKVFKKVAPHIFSDIIRQDEELRAQIATDLSQYLRFGHNKLPEDADDE